MKRKGFAIRGHGRAANVASPGHLRRDAGAKRASPPRARGGAPGASQAGEPNASRIISPISRRRATGMREAVETMLIAASPASGSAKA